MSQVVSCLIFLGILVTHIVYVIFRDKRYGRIVEAQQETINKLLNREPVTYKEVNAQPPKLDTDRPIAWGGTIANRDEL